MTAASHRQKPATADLLIDNATIITSGGDLWADSAAAAVQDGLIIAVGSSRELADVEATETIDAHGGVLHAGLVDAHVHLRQHLGRSVIPSTWGHGGEMRHWLPYLRHISPEEQFTAAQLACAEMALAGTTTFCDMGGGAPSLDAARTVGLRGSVTPLVWDRAHGDMPAMTTAEALDRLEELLALPEPPGVYSVASVGLPDRVLCSPALIAAAMELALRHRRRMVIHEAFVAQDAEAERRAGVDGLNDLDQLGVLGPSLVLAHLNSMTDGQVELMAARHASAVHCPAACLRVAAGGTRAGKVPELLRHGVPVALGSDAGNYSDSLDVLFQAHLAATIHGEARGQPGVVTARDAFTMATSGGARALGLDQLIGSVRAGLQADLVLWPVDDPALRPALDPIQTLVFGSTRSRPAMVCVGGQIIVRDGRTTLVDLDELCRAAASQARALHQRMGLLPPLTRP